MSARESFEKWITVFYNNEVPRKLDDGVYIDNDIRTRWIAWQASRAQAIDECLQLHESIKVTPLHESIKITPPDNDDWIDAIIDSREAYQQAIKQLKEQP